MIPKDVNPRVQGAGRHSGPLHRELTARRRIEVYPLDGGDPTPLTSELKREHLRGGDEITEGRPSALAKAEKESINVVLDFNDPEQGEKFEAYRAAFGQGHTEVEHLEDGLVVLRIYPGAAKGLR